MKAFRCPITSGSVSIMASVAVASIIASVAVGSGIGASVAGLVAVGSSSPLHAIAIISMATTKTAMSFLAAILDFKCFNIITS